jgi:tetratricopeptide (TPR) repeat protein
VTSSKSKPSSSGPRIAISIGLAVVLIGALAVALVRSDRDAPAGSPGAARLDTTPAPLDSLDAYRGDRPPELPPDYRESLLAEVEELETAIRNAPDDPMLRLELSVKMRDLGREEDAARLVLEAYEVAPERPEVLFNLAMYRIAAGQWDLAEAALVELARIDPDNGAARRTLEQIREARRAQKEGDGAPPVTSP